MTATIKPPKKGASPRGRVRISSMEILGFSDSSFMWTDTPPTTSPEVSQNGRHEATVADMQPEEFGDRLTGGDVRWGMLVIMLLMVAGLGGLGYWLYQRPISQEEAATSQINTQATRLSAAMPALEEMNERLLASDATDGESALFAVETAARDLFESSGRLGSTQAEMRAAASRASEATLAGVRLANGAHAYRAALLPVLTTPEFETDPDLVALDEAARQFGEWQLTISDVRSVLPDDVLPDVTEQIDTLTGDLTSLLGRYVDALREDDERRAQAVLSDLELRLGEIEDTLDASLEDVRERVGVRVEEARQALELILGG